jgi:transposase
VQKKGPCGGKNQAGQGDQDHGGRRCYQSSSGRHRGQSLAHESKLVGETLAGSFLDQLPERLIGDKAYDSDPLDRHLDEEYGIEMIAPNRENRSRTQDGRKLRRYRKRWAVERLFAWLQWFRRLVTRYEFHAENFLGMVRLGCMKIMLRYL